MIEIEDIVYLKTDTELLPRIVIKYEVSKSGTIYNLGCGSSSSWHYDFEFTKDKNELTSRVGYKHAN